MKFQSFFHNGRPIYSQSNYLTSINIRPFCWLFQTCLWVIVFLHSPATTCVCQLLCCGFCLKTGFVFRCKRFQKPCLVLPCLFCLSFSSSLLIGWGELFFQPKMKLFKDFSKQVFFVKGLQFSCNSNQSFNLWRKDSWRKNQGFFVSRWFCLVSSLYLSVMINIHSLLYPWQIKKTSFHDDQNTCGYLSIKWCYLSIEYWQKVVFF